jgi:hypoxanthine phosphoribosyltransferase
MGIANMKIGQMRDRQRLHRADPTREGPSEAIATLAQVTPELPDFQAYCGTEPPRFANPAELEYAKILDWYGIPWQYEPTTFVLERDEEGRVSEAFTPDFYLPDQDLYLEVTVMKQSLVTRKNRKLRKLRMQRPDIKIKLFYERDFERLAQRYGLRKAS